MIDDSIGEGAGEDSDNDKEPDSGVKIYASLGSLSVGDTPPEIGDEVELTVKGAVNSIEGDVACVSPTEVNGEPAPEPPGEESGPGEDDMTAMHDKLMQGAMNEDKMGGMGY